MVSPSTSGAWTRDVQGPSRRCSQACDPHVHVACSVVPITSLPVPGARRAEAPGREEEVTRTGVWPGVWVGDLAL